MGNPAHGDCEQQIERVGLDIVSLRPGCSGTSVDQQEARGTVASTAERNRGAQLVGERPDDGVPWIAPRRAHCSPGKSDRSAAGWRLSEWTTCQTVAADVRMPVLSSVGVKLQIIWRNTETDTIGKHESLPPVYRTGQGYESSHTRCVRGGGGGLK